jgi:hypothetical protein
VRTGRAGADASSTAPREGAQGRDVGPRGSPTVGQPGPTRTSQPAGRALSRGAAFYQRCAGTCHRAPWLAHYVLSTNFARTCAWLRSRTPPARRAWPVGACQGGSVIVRRRLPLARAARRPVAPGGTATTSVHPSEVRSAQEGTTSDQARPAPPGAARTLPRCSRRAAALPFLVERLSECDAGQATEEEPERGSLAPAERAGAEAELEAAGGRERDGDRVPPAPPRARRRTSVSAR